ncbi:MAG: acyl carrier protein [Hyphomicrobiales bacterium]|nr:acyl carrier protein [Hyphomicrobiales bacterium]
MELFEIIAGVLKIDPAMLSYESNAQNTENWNSLRHIEIMLAVENAFSVRFSMPEMVSMENVGDLRDLLIAKGVSLDGPIAEPVSA